jgi:hypothetical protein
MSDSLTRPEPGERPRRYRRGNALADTLAASFGLGMYDLFRLAGGERQKILVKSAERFQRSVDVPGWKPVLSMPIELGGSVENDLMLFAYVQLTDAAEWRELLGEATSISVDAWRMRAGFVSRRVFDPGISNAHDAPVVRFEEELVIMATPGI